MDEDRLSEFRTKRDEWLALHRLNLDEPNSLERQLHSMFFFELLYRVALDESAFPESPLASVPMLRALLNDGYFSSQVLALNRLLDQENDVHSVQRLFTDVRKHHHLFTREIFVCFDGTPYSPAFPEQFIPGLQSPDSDFSNFYRSTQRHELFDRLAEMSADAREPTDMVNKRIFRKLGNWLNVGSREKLRLIRNKYLAHAADRGSRRNFEPTGINFTEIEQTQRAIVRVTRAVVDVLLQSGVATPVVPSPPLGFFGEVWKDGKFAEAPSRMQSTWDELSRKRNDWAFGIIDELCANTEECM